MKRSSGENPLKVGQLVQVIAGRDIGSICIVSKVIDSRFLWICDGRQHTIECPKKKNQKHLKALCGVAQELTYRLSHGQHVSDVEISMALDVWAAGNRDPKGQEGDEPHG